MTNDLFKLISWTPGTGGQRERFPAGYWSVSRVRNAAKCLRAFDQRYNRGHDKDADTDRSGADLGSAVHDALERTYLWIDENFYSGPFPRHVAKRMLRIAMRNAGLFNEDLFSAARKMILNHALVQGDVDCMHVLGVEVEFRITIGGIPFGGYMDRVDATTPDGEPSTHDITIRDYKSAKWLPTDLDVEDDLQASIYMAAAKLRWPGKRIHFVFDMLRHGLTLETEHSDDRAEAAAEYVQMVVEHASGGSFPATLNTMCSWCDYRSGCPAYQQAITDDPSFREPDERDLVALIEERNRLSAIAMATRQRAAKLDAAIMRPVSQMDKERRMVAKAVQKARKAAEKAHKGAASQDAIESDALRRASAELDMPIHRMHEIMGRESLHAGPYTIRIAKRQRPSQATYKVKTVAKVLDDLGICDAEDAPGKIQMVSTRKLSKLITDRTRDWTEIDRMAARIEVEACGRMSYESSLDIRRLGW